MKNALIKYLSVTKKEWNGLVILVILITIVLFAPIIYQWLYPYKLIDLKGFDAAAAQLKYAGSDSRRDEHSQLFRFNPNKLSTAQWAKLGLSQAQIKVINNYHTKGGRFYTKEDVKKIYAITDDDYQRLSPFIDLPERPAYIKKSDVIVEINSADTSKLMQIRGIGSGFAARILRYRDRLGGYYNKKQLKEVFGVDSLMYLDIAPFIKVNNRLITKINLNKATMNSLMVFPYLTYKQKNAIVEYHNQHGDYSGTADLKNIPIIDDNILRKIEPYICFK